MTVLAASCAATMLAVTPVSAAPPDLGSSIDGNAVNRHLIALQRIADQNGGNRASGQPGYEASVDYVVDKLKRAGFDVTTPEFTYEAYFKDSFSLAVAGQPVEGDALEYSPATPQGGLTAPLAVAPVDETPGCEATDYDGANVAGTVVLISRGACSFADKQRIASEAGAVGAIIYNNVEGPLNGTLGDADAGRIPTAGVTQQVGQALAGQAGAEVKLDVQARFESVTTRNVVAQTKTGRADNVVMAGAHLDGVPEGPGINDNGSGSAGLLETALKLGGSPKGNQNAVRFAWWGAEESGLVGSTKYVQSLSQEEQLDIALYMNFDMIGSPNAGYFVYDGDGSTGGPSGPVGSGQIKNDFIAAMAAQGVESEPSEFNGRSDYGEFIAVGIPSGGMHTGVEDLKTEEQAAKWGGTAGVAFDPNYHGAGDNLSNIDRVALERMTKGMANVVQAYSQSTEGVNGVQSREERAKLRAQQSALTVQSAGPKVGHGHNLA
ncbi:M28 family metallopeptidase [Saccharopolyspora oryzae]|uniref:M28 family metallopeptidase n=1 Tax=Saccharopolyspora oryzae TaxID=2997343 RepID=A0ABT4V4C3_9PSEU|nr:M28 family metallopeptidase [Saccharopolyspora oryzae]MDA3628668.1 M28 family metallopeptidase [Saccharopolyspora oryzae]